MAAHHTAALVQSTLRQAIYERVTALGPAHFTRSRTGDVILSMVEGVQQLEVYFGQYLPQLAVAALTPVLIFAFVAFVDLPVALVLLAAALVTLVAPSLWHRKDSRAEPGPPEGLCRLRRGVPRLRPGPGHAQGLRPERRARARMLGEKGTRSLLQHHGRARDEHVRARHHRHRHGGGRGGRAGPRRLAGARRGDDARRAPRRPHAGRRGVPPAARAAGACSTRACSASPRRGGIMQILEARARGERSRHAAARRRRRSRPSWPSRT